MDTDTAAFLQEKEQKITQIRMMSVMAIGKELKEIHEKLANHYQRSFGKWCESISISRMTADRYIKAYDYVVTNCDNIEAAENIQTSLLFAISKPSAPAELQYKEYNLIVGNPDNQSLVEEFLNSSEGRNRQPFYSSYAANQRVSSN